VTLDKDFGELVIVREMPHVGIIRLVNFRAADQARACLLVVQRYEKELAQGAIVTVEPGRVRIRPGALSS